MRSPFKPEHLLGPLVFATILLIFWFSPVQQVTDSNYSMMVSECLLHHRSFALDHYAVPRLKPTFREDYIENGDIDQLEQAKGHIFYFFPQGSSVLSLPYVALMNSFGISAVAPDGTYYPQGESRIQTGLAALLMAGLSAIFFYTARLVLPIRWSLLVALSGALGTQVWSTASRGLWSDTWGIFLLGIVIYILLASETGEARLRPALLATLLSWSYFVRPTASVSVIAVSAYMLLFYRRFVLSYALTGLLWLAGFVAYSWHNFGTPLPHYYMANRLRFGTFWTALAGNLISPARGVLIYVPVLFFIVYALVRYRNHIEYVRLVFVAVIAIVLHVAAVSGFTHWWGGHNYGPRLTTGLVPWFVLLGVVALQGMLRWRREYPAIPYRTRWRFVLSGGALLLSMSVFINARGALSPETWRWNMWMENTPGFQGLWDWTYPQFLAGLLPPATPGGYPPVKDATRLDFGRPEAGPFLWYGWSSDEDLFRWSDGPEAAIVFSLDEIGDTVLRLRVGPFLVPGRLDEQHVDVLLNGGRIGQLELKDPGAQEYSFLLPKSLLRRNNAIKFEIPGAASPKSLQGGNDIRLLGIRVEWIEFRAKGQ
jgi:hypothetical protein